MEEYILFGTELAVPDIMLIKFQGHAERGTEPTVRDMEDMARYKEERNAALLSLDRDKIITYAMRWGIDMSKMPADEDGFWAAVHTAISSIRTMPAGLRRASIAYLVERGLPRFDDFDDSGDSGEVHP